MLRKLVLSYGLIILLALLSLSLFLYLVVQEHLLSRQEAAQLMQAQIIATGLGRFTPEEQERAIASWARQVSGRLALLDESGHVLYDAFADPTIVGRQLTYSEIASALGGRPGTSRYLHGQSWSLQVAVPIWQAREVVGSVLYVEPLSDIQRSLSSLRLALLLGNLAILALTVLLSVVLATRLTAPVKRLDRAVQALAAGRSHSPLTAKGKDELATLTNSFNVMAYKLHRLEKQRQQFMADAAHELRTPLASLQALLEPLTTFKGPPPADWQSYIQDALGEADRLHRLVEDLLQASHLEGTVQLARAETLIGEVARSVVRLMEPVAHLRQVNLDHLPLNYEVVMMVDGEKLKQVFLNILDNAIKHSPAQSRVQVSEHFTGQLYQLQVKDEGPGIPSEDLPHIFERFYRGDKARHRDTGGSGLGLAIAAKIVELHGGTIDVESEPGRGSRFTVNLPVASSPPTQINTNIKGGLNSDKGKQD